MAGKAVRGVDCGEWEGEEEEEDEEEDEVVEGGSRRSRGLFPSLSASLFVLSWPEGVQFL